MKKRMLSILLCCIMIFGLFVPGVGEETDVENSVQTIINGMTLRQKICQMLMVDFRYWNSGNGQQPFTVMNDQIRQIVQDYQFGAIIYFAQNMTDTSQVYTLTKELQTAATKNGGVPMIITADQEGGIVYRLATGTALPGNMAVGATGNPEYARVNGNIIGREFASLGMNSSLSPVVDVNNNANNPVIGLRSYSDNPTLVGQMAAAQIGGMKEQGILACAKHFPGHGDTATDSHYGLPVVNKDLKTLQSCELKPYEIAIENGLDMIMTAHILYPQLEKDTVVSNKTGKAESLPATLSDDIITNLLKNQMGFKGIVTTDAMNMAGISNSWDQVQAAVLAISAGVDMLCMPCTLYSKNDLKNLDAIISGIETAVNNGTIPLSRIQDAVTRIITVKAKNGILQNNTSHTSLEHANQVVGGSLNRQSERELSAAAVTVVQNKNNTLPLSLTQNSKVLMMVPYNNEQGQMSMGWNRAKQAGLIPQGAQVRVVKFSSARLRDVQSDIDWADTIIINSEIGSASTISSNNYLYAGPKAFVDYAESVGKTTVVQSVDKPYDLQLYENADAVLAVYGCMGSNVDPTAALTGNVTSAKEAFGPNIIAGIEVIFGVFGASGSLSVKIPKYQNGSYTGTIVYDQGYGLTYSAKHTHTYSLVHDPNTYCKDFYECEGCGMWFETPATETAILNKFDLLGQGDQTPQDPQEPDIPQEPQDPQEPEVPQDPQDPATPAFGYGDVNADRYVDAKDALLVLRNSVGKMELTPEEIRRGEVDGKEGLTARDALEILKYSVGKIAEFPIEKQ